MAATCGHTNDYLKAQPLEALWFGAQSSSGRGSGLGWGVRKPRAIFPCCCSLGYLERWELLWDWLEDVVAPLSWEKPLLQDSRLDMDPLR